MSQRKQYQNLFTFVDHILISFAVRLGLRLRLLMPLSVASTDIFLLFTFIYFSRWGQALYLMHFYSIPFTCFPYKVSAVAAIVVYFLSPMLFCFKQFFSTAAIRSVYHLNCILQMKTLISISVQALENRIHPTGQ